MMASGGAWWLFAALFLALLLGYPVAFTLAGVSLLAALIGWWAGVFDPAFLYALPSRVFGIMTNETLLAVPLFVLMGVVLERARLAEDLLHDAAVLFRGTPAGMALAVIIVGALLAASSGIVGTTVVTMGLLALPAMLQRRYPPGVAGGTICAAGTLGQLIPPSIALVLLGDVLGNAYQQAQLSLGVFSPRAVSVGDLFAGALLPGLLLVTFYLIFLLWRLRPGMMVESPGPESGTLAGEAGRRGRQFWHHLWRLAGGPLLLMLAVLGSILGGIATPTEAAAVGAFGAVLLAVLRRRFSFDLLLQAASRSVRISSMVFMILIGAALFSMVFRGFGGDQEVRAALAGLPGGEYSALPMVMAAVFVLGFALDFIEIIYVVVPIVGPPLMALGVDPLWLGVLLAVNLQTSFLTPPFGFALFYLRGVAPPDFQSRDLYRGVVPFIGLQLLLLVLLFFFPQLATWLPAVLRS